MCEILDMPRSTYYQALNQTISNREKENIELTKKLSTYTMQVINVMVHQKYMCF